MVSVVLFSGGRGSDVLSRQLIGHPDVALTIAINGYDDGASTGEVRRFLGDSLGPSDFRKNASRVARETQSCPEGIIEALDTRLPDPCSREEALQALEGVAIAGGPQMRQRIDAVRRELDTGRPFEFSDCAIGNLVFAGSLPASRPPVQRRGRRLLRAARASAGPHRQRHRRHERVSGGARARSRRAGERSRDRRRETAEPDLGRLPDRSAAVRRRPDGTGARCRQSSARRGSKSARGRCR